MNTKNTIVIGDIHGRFHTFCKMLHVLERYGLEQSNLVLVGDYIDRGPYSKAVIDKIMELEKTFPNIIMPLKGNHEDMCVKFYTWTDEENPYQAKRLGEAFLYNGGLMSIYRPGIKILTAEDPIEYVYDEMAGA